MNLDFMRVFLAGDDSSDGECEGFRWHILEKKIELLYFCWEGRLFFLPGEKIIAVCLHLEVMTISPHLIAG